jgi:hypothetical protein
MTFSFWDEEDDCKSPPPGTLAEVDAFYDEYIEPRGGSTPFPDSPDYNLPPAPGLAEHDCYYETYIEPKSRQK